MLRKQNIKHPIAQRLIFYIVIFSSMVTLFITTIQLYRDYKTDINLINDEFEQIEYVHLNSLNSALWASNQNLLQTSIEGILKIRDVQYVEIRDEDKVWAQAGKVKAENNLQRSYGMVYNHRNKNINIGVLTVNASLAGVRQRLIDKVWVILIANAVKISLVALFFYYVFYRLVTKHLTTISEFSEKHDPLSSNVLLELDRNKKRHDEFDALVNSINEMNVRLQKQIVQVNNQRRYLSQTLDSIGDAVITTDDIGRVTRLNPVAEKLTGWKNEDAMQQPLKKIFPIVNTSTREAINDPVEKVLAKGEVIYLSNHTTLISKDGKEYQIADSAAPIRSDGKILGMVLVFNDVTEQYRMRLSLQDSENKLRLIHSQVPGIVYQFKVDEGGDKFFPYISPSIVNFIGLTAEEVQEDIDKWLSLTHPDDLPGLEISIVESLNNFTKWEWEGRFIRSDGKIIWLHGTSAPEKMEDGSTVWNGLFVDVTDRVNADEAIRRSQKMDALGKLTGGIAHDYNNMLGVMLGYAELLSPQLDAQPKLQAYVDKITHAGERGAKLTKKLLTFSKSKSTDIRVLNINTLLQDDRSLLEKTLTARIKLKLKLEKDLWSVCLDDSELEDAVLNICINAMHAIKNNGRLTIETRNGKIKSEAAINMGLDAGDYVLLRFVDTGCGMDESIKEKIFDPFYSTKGEKGTGLGLSQVYGFMTRCGGIIKVDSILQRGTSFTLYFPRHLNKSESVNESQSELKNNHTLSGQETILVVDDEPALLELCSEILKQNNYHVLVAERAEQALEIIAKKKIDLLVSDIIMPDMDGYALAAIVRDKYPNIKIQLVSGYSGEQHPENIGDDLFKNLLRKPYNTQTLLKNIRNLLKDY